MEKRKKMVEVIMGRLCGLSAYKSGSRVAITAEEGIKNNLTNDQLDSLYTLVVLGMAPVEEVMSEWTCGVCGHLVVAKGKPEPIHWTDGHVCGFWKAAPA